MTTVPHIERLAEGYDTATFRDYVNAKFSGDFAPVHRVLPVDDGAPWAHAERFGIVEESTAPNLPPSLPGWD